MCVEINCCFSSSGLVCVWDCELLLGVRFYDNSRSSNPEPYRLKALNPCRTVFDPEKTQGLLGSCVLGFSPKFVILYR